MISIERTSIFKKDYKRLKKKHYDMDKLKEVIVHLINEDTEFLRTKFQDHSLNGNWQGYRELHVQNDWLLIYKIKKENLILVLVRTGSHDKIL